MLVNVTKGAYTPIAMIECFVSIFLNNIIDKSFAKIINNIKKWKVRKREKKRGNKSFELHAVHGVFSFSMFCTNLMWLNISRDLFAFHNTPCYGVKKQAQNSESLIYNGLQEYFHLFLNYLKMSKTSKTENTWENESLL